MNLIWTPGMSLDDVEKEAIMLALKYNHGNKTHTASALGIAYRTLDDKLKRYKDKEDEIRKISEERKIKRNELLRTERGLPVEHVAQLSKEPALPVQERKEIQEMSSPENASRGAHTKKNKRDVK